MARPRLFAFLSRFKWFQWRPQESEWAKRALNAESRLATWMLHDAAHAARTRRLERVILQLTSENSRLKRENEFLRKPHD